MRNLLIALLLLLPHALFAQTLMNVYHDGTISSYDVSHIDSINFTLMGSVFPPGPGVVDIDGNMYSSIMVNVPNTGSYIEWMTSNLRVSRYANGDLIPNVTGQTAWNALTTGAWCHYNNDSAYQNPNGKYYNWYAVTDPRNVCPSGWSVATSSQWFSLTTAIGGNNIGAQLKSITGWSSNGGGTNESGFNAYPSGERWLNGSDVIGQFARFWLTGEYSPANGSMRQLSWYNNASINSSNIEKITGLSVRCTKYHP